MKFKGQNIDPDIGIRKYGLATRMMHSSELLNRLENLKSAGVFVPILRSSNYSPKYLKTDNDDVEWYSFGGMMFSVEPGQVIDTKGNVVDLRKLEEKASVIISTEIERE
jgi:hypothetical protein